MADDATVANAAAPPRDVRWERGYWGVLGTVREVRLDVREILADCPESVADDAVMVVSELAANAIRHSLSGGIGGTYTVRVYHYPTRELPYVWVEVEDLGNPSWDGTLRMQPTHGLAVVYQLAASMGSEKGPHGTRTVYARLEYSADGTPIHANTRAPELPADLRELANPKAIGSLGRRSGKIPTSP